MLIVKDARKVSQLLNNTASLAAVALMDFNPGALPGLVLLTCRFLF
jgi:hypothetical protein